MPGPSISKMIAVALAATVWVSVVAAQDLVCAECHDDVVATSPAHPDAECGDCHTNVPPDHEGDDLEPLTDEESCGDCHRRPHRESGRSVHGDDVTCIDCHGDPHDLHLVEDSQSAVSAVNQIQYCGSCHDDPPSLINGYLASVHARGLLLSGLDSAPSCSDCHGVHGIREIDDPKAPTSHANSPEMCGSCHGLLLETWQVDSAHGLAWVDESGGVDTVSMMVNTDASAIAEVYTSSNGDIDFYVVGYWSTPPGTYTAHGGAHSQMSQASSWQAWNLASYGVPAGSVAQIVITNDGDTAEQEMGVRRSGSSAARLLDLQEAESGGSDNASMHVIVNGSSSIEAYSESGPNDRYFYPVGWWVL